jgi:uncharacterized membrane protein YhaH (DUF805 family)
MKGEVLNYDDNAGVGQISGADGIRYSFTRADLKQLVPISKGTQVDFDFDGKQAKDIYVVEQPQQSAYPGAAVAPQRYSGPVEPDLGLWGYFTRTLTSNYANFSGRARRKEYWGFALFSIIVYVILWAIMAAGIATAPRNADGSMGTPSPLFWVGIGLLVIYGLATIIPSLGLTVRRLHDIGWPGWIVVILVILGIIPYLGIVAAILGLVIACIDTQPFVNKFGPPPKAVA